MRQEERRATPIEAFGLAPRRLLAAGEEPRQRHDAAVEDRFAVGHVLPAGTFVVVVVRDHRDTREPAIRPRGRGFGLGTAPWALHIEPPRGLAAQATEESHWRSWTSSWL